jgi:hypothetical protein
VETQVLRTSRPSGSELTGCTNGWQGLLSYRVLRVCLKVGSMWLAFERLPPKYESSLLLNIRAFGSQTNQRVTGTVPTRERESAVARHHACPRVATHHAARRKPLQWQLSRDMVHAKTHGVTYLQERITFVWAVSWVGVSCCPVTAQPVGHSVTVILCCCLHVSCTLLLELIPNTSNVCSLLCPLQLNQCERERCTPCDGGCYAWR